MKITQELASTIHHVRLNEKGWWGKTIQRFVLIYLMFENKYISKIEVMNNLNKEYFNNALDAKEIEKQINTLIKENKILVLDDKIKISEEEHNKIAEEYNKFDLIEKDTKNIYKQILESFYKKNNINQQIDIDKEWDYFDTQILIPLINALGARTYELISGSRNLSNYDFKFIKNTRIDTQIILQFLDSKNSQVKEYILRKLNAYFCYESSKLSKKVIDRLSVISKQNISFTIFVDTNFLFSALALHNNPENEATNALLELTNKIENKIQLKFFILEPTIKEAKNVLFSQKMLAQDLRYIPNINKSSKIQLNGLIKQFFSTNQKIKGAEYFDRYIDNLKTFADSKKIHFFNDNTIQDYSTKQKVMDDLNDEFNSQNNKKTYEQLKHDIVLWHFVRDKRLSVVESPLESKFWIVTNDNKFINFDKRKIESSSIPICATPTNLIQLLQFWIPRSEVFEDAMLKSLKLPFLFHEFDTSAEKITIEILNVLSSYEHQETDSLSTDVVEKIILDDTLRQKISSATNKNEKEKLVENALIKEINIVKKEVEKHKKELENVNKKLKEKVEIIELKNKNIDRIEKNIFDKENEKNKIQEQTAKDKEILENKINEQNLFTEKLLKEKYDIYVEKEAIKQVNIREKNIMIVLLIVFLILLLFLFFVHINFIVEPICKILIIIFPIFGSKFINEFNFNYKDIFIMFVRKKTINKLKSNIMSFEQYKKEKLYEK